MRLGRLVIAGLAIGALLGFLAGLVRPRPRGDLTTFVSEPVDPPGRFPLRPAASRPAVSQQAEPDRAVVLDAAEAEQREGSDR